MRKPNRDEAITTDTFAKICRYLNCKVGDIVNGIESDGNVQQLRKGSILCLLHC